MSKRRSMRRRRARVHAPVINHIFRSPDGEEYVLVLVESRSWSEPGVLGEVAERIELCAGYVLDGRLAAEFPETVGSSVRIHVDHLAPANEQVEAVFARATAALAEHGLPFTAEWLDPDGSFD